MPRCLTVLSSVPEKRYTREAARLAGESIRACRAQVSVSVISSGVFGLTMSSAFMHTVSAVATLPRAQ